MDGKTNGKVATVSGTVPNITQVQTVKAAIYKSGHLCLDASVSGQRDIQRRNAGRREGVKQTASRRLTDRCRTRMHGVGVFEVVVGVYVVLVENRTSRAGDAGSVNDNLGGQGLVEMRIHDSKCYLFAIARS